MASVRPTSSLKEYQQFAEEVYGSNNQRDFTIHEMLTNISRFSMRGLKGVRKGDNEKTKTNIVIAISWFISLMNQLHIDVEESVWQRFPYLCSYCGECPCVCKTKKTQKRIKIKVNKALRPKTIRGFQKMFNDIYPAKNRTLEHAGIHLAEEVGELSEAVLKFRGHHMSADFDNVVLEASDLFSCLVGVLNSLGVDYHKILVEFYSDGCHVCKGTPCVCKYDFVINFKS